MNIYYDVEDNHYRTYPDGDIATIDQMRELIEIKFEEGGHPYLRSTAKEITDTWSNNIARESGRIYTKKIKTKGGGIQTFIPGQSWKENSIKKRNADIIHL